MTARRSAENDAPWNDGDTITSRATGQTYTRRGGMWWCSPDPTPKTDAQATATVERTGRFVDVCRVIPPVECACGHPHGDHDDTAACMHLCDCAWPIPPAETEVQS